MMPSNSAGSEAASTRSTPELPARLNQAGAVALVLSAVLFPLTHLTLARENSSVQDAFAERSDLDLARRLAEEARLEAAAAAYRRHLQKVPDSFEAHFELGQLLVSMGRLEEARGQFATAARLRPDLAIAHVRLAQTCLRLDDLAQAEVSLTEARRLEPNEPSTLYNLGRIYEKQARDDQALEQYLAFLEIAPDDPRSNNIRARVALYYENAQRLDDAVDLYFQILGRDPGRASAWFSLAGIHYRRGQYDMALPEYEEAIRLEPANPGAWANIGYILRLKGKLEESATHYARAVQLAPEDISSSYFFGSVQADLGLVDEAMKSFETVVTLQPDHPLVHYAIGKLHLKRGNREAAQREFDLHRRIQAEARKSQRTVTTMEEN